MVYIKKMTQIILFLIVVIVAAAYGSKYAEKAKADIKEFNQAQKSKARQAEKLAYLKTNVFTGLQNRNEGMDSESIHYFSEADFETVIDRVEKLGIGILGIEPWLNGELYGVKVAEDYGGNPTDAQWYRKAFAEFKASNETPLLYAASYQLPKD